MCKYQLRINRILIVWIVVFLSISNQVFWFDLLWELNSTFDKYDRSIDYMEDIYDSKYSKDPFGDALKTVSDMSIQTKLSWVEYVKNALSESNCNMSQKKILWILYYFSPNFRSDLSRSLRMKSWNVDSKKYILDWETVAKYCSEYYKCVNQDNGKSTRENKEKISELIAATPNAVETSCKEFFLNHYDEWRLNEDMVQNIQKSQLWADKFWNATIEDSPYDIVTDIETVGKFLFQEAEWPITPVFYNLPVFSKSAESLANDSKSANSGWNWWNSKGDGVWDSGWDKQSQKDDEKWREWTSLNPASTEKFKEDNWWNNNVSWEDPSLPNPLQGWSQMLDDVMDDMVEWLIVSDLNWIFKGVNCSDEQIESEPESKSIVSQKNDESENSVPEYLGLSQEEFQAAVDYMFDAMDKFTSLPEDKKEEMAEKAWDTSRYLDTDGSLSQELQQQRIADEIKNCWQSCEWLRYDQELSCKLMCACWEWKSPIFDPESTPGLWPIAMIKFCTVPWVDSRFSVGGRKMVSIEEWVKEMFWVVDKLSREWRLWIWTQQYNFLDSSTKKMDFWKSVSFSINIDWIDIFSNWSTQSQQFKDKEATISNTQWQIDSHIKNSLEDPVSKNRYRIVYEDTLNDYWAWVIDNNQAADGTDVEMKSVVDQGDVSTFDRYVLLSYYLDMWMDQEWEFWNFALGWINDLKDSANILLSKKW